MCIIVISSAARLSVISEDSSCDPACSSKLLRRLMSLSMYVQLGLEKFSLF